MTDSAERDEIYIDCQPVNSEGIEIIKYGDDGETAGAALNKFFKQHQGVVIGLVTAGGLGLGIYLLLKIL